MLVDRHAAQLSSEIDELAATLAVLASSGGVRSRESSRVARMADRLEQIDFAKGFSAGLTASQALLEQYRRRIRKPLRGVQLALLVGCVAPREVTAAISLVHGNNATGDGGEGGSRGNRGVVRGGKPSAFRSGFDFTSAGGSPPLVAGEGGERMAVTAPFDVHPFGRVLGALTTSPILTAVRDVVDELSVLLLDEGRPFLSLLRIGGVDGEGGGDVGEGMNIHIFSCHCVTESFTNLISINDFFKISYCRNVYRATARATSND